MVWMGELEDRGGMIKKNIGTKVKSIMQGRRNGTNHIRGKRGKLNSKLHDISIRHT